MRRYLIGFLVGIMFGAASSVLAARIVGSNGYAMGWTVTVDGDEVCSDPYIWTSTQEIECD